MRSTIILILFVSVLVGISCEDRSIAFDPQKQLGIDTVLIDEYLSANSIVAQTHESGLRFVVLQPGSGDRPGPDKCIRVNYKLWFLGETTVFEEGTNFATALTAKNILGWRIGLKEIQKGGKIMLYVPSGLAYGSSAYGEIPKNQVLMFEVELLDITGYNSAGGYCYPWPQ